MSGSRRSPKRVGRSLHGCELTVTLGTMSSRGENIAFYTAEPWTVRGSNPNHPRPRIVGPFPEL
jgi:hypothetical protein